jgi:hypothetical protein
LGCNSSAAPKINNSAGKAPLTRRYSAQEADHVKGAEQAAMK